MPAAAVSPFLVAALLTVIVLGETLNASRAGMSPWGRRSWR
ncbi:hypothetical protein [Mycobacterium shigaense]|nr:hypothetical protein [Mycobacterium shigaense]MEA1123806.1 hypothetical protein [Mycobacterium shigaense]